jgi:hypothetical protein
MRSKTKDCGCAACTKGREIAEEQEAEAKASANRRRPAAVQTMRRTLLGTAALCHRTLLPMAYCAGCEQGWHS